MHTIEILGSKMLKIRKEVNTVFEIKLMNFLICLFFKSELFLI